MSVRFTADLGKDGTITWDTSASELVDLHENHDLRRYVENELTSMARIFLGALRSPDTAQALQEFSNLITTYAQNRIARIRQLESN